MKYSTSKFYRGSKLVGIALMLIGWMMISTSISAQAQTEEKAVNAVDTAAILARLNSRAADSLFSTGQPVPEPVVKLNGNSTKGDLPRLRAESFHDETAVGVVTRNEATPSTTQSSSYDAKYQLTPYIWFSGFNGDIGVRGRVVRVDASFSDIFDELNFGVMATFEARWGGKWKFLLDGIYMNLSDGDVNPGPFFDGAEITAKALIIDPEIGYAIVGGETSRVDLFGGFRLYHIENGLELRQGAGRLNLSQTQTWADPVVGFRVKAGGKAYLTMKADIGGFGLGSELTWQAFGGLGINLCSRLAIIIGYRYLDIDYRRNGFIYDVALGGPLLGFGFRF